MKIRKVKYEVIKNAHFTPEPHTVILNKDKPNSEWWILSDNDIILCVVCIVKRAKEIHFARTYTPPEYRRKGYCTALLQYLSAKVYPFEKLTAHCLKASVHCYSMAGFVLVCEKTFKHSKMYYMERKRRSE